MFPAIDLHVRQTHILTSVHNFCSPLQTISHKNNTWYQIDEEVVKLNKSQVEPILITFAYNGIPIPDGTPRQNKLQEQFKADFDYHHQVVLMKQPCDSSASVTHANGSYHHQVVSVHQSFCQLASAFLGDRNGLCVTIVPVARLCFRRNTVECKESRLGKKPIEVPSNVVITLQGQDMKVKGPFGELALSYPREIMIDRQDAILKVCKAVETRRANQMHRLFSLMWIMRADQKQKRVTSAFLFWRVISDLGSDESAMVFWMSRLMGSHLIS